MHKDQRVLATTPFAGRTMRLATNSDERTQVTLWRNLLLADQQNNCVACSPAGVHLPTDESGHHQAAEQESEIAQVQQTLRQTGHDILFVHTTSADLRDTGRVLLTRPATQ